GAAEAASTQDRGRGTLRRRHAHPAHRRASPGGAGTPAAVRPTGCAPPGPGDHQVCVPTRAGRSKPSGHPRQDVYAPSGTGADWGPSCRLAMGRQAIERCLAPPSAIAPATLRASGTICTHPDRRGTLPPCLLVTAAPYHAIVPSTVRAW